MGIRSVLFPKVEAAQRPLDVEASLAPYYSETSPFFFAGLTSATRGEAISVPAVARSVGEVWGDAQRPRGRVIGAHGRLQISTVRVKEAGPAACVSPPSCRCSRVLAYRLVFSGVGDASDTCAAGAVRLSRVSPARGAGPRQEAHVRVHKAISM